MGHQFVHVYSYSEAGKNPLAGCLGEALREPGYAPHVENPKPPEWLFGNRGDLETAIRAYREGFKDSRGHRLRKDGQVLRADVVSWPPDMPDDERKKGEKLTVEYYKNKYGTSFRGALRHTDEPFRDSKYKGAVHHHMHLYIVPEANQKFEEVHPGLKAKRAADKSNRADAAAGKKVKPEDKARGNEAYRKAMRRDIQDDFYKNVASKLDLSRTGPQMERINQKAQRIINDARKEAGEIIAAAEKQAEGIRNDAGKEADGIRKRAELELEKVEKRERDVSVREKSIGEKEEAFNEGFNLKLKEWDLPDFYEDEHGKFPFEHFKPSYFYRVKAWAAGLVEKVSRLINEYTKKNAEVESLKKKTEFELGRLQGRYGTEKQVKQYVASMDALGWKLPAGKGQGGIIKP